MSPHELVFGHKAMISHELEIRPDVVVSGMFTEYYEWLIKNLIYIRSERTDLLNRNKEYHTYEVGQIVYMYQAKGSIVQTGSWKIACYFVGSLVIYKAIGPNQFLLMSLTGQIYPHLIEETRLKPGSIRTGKGNVSTLAELKEALNVNI